MTSASLPAGYTATASTEWDAAYAAWRAFDDESLSITSYWSTVAARYTAATPGLYTGVVSTTVSGSPVLGEWIQITFPTRTVSAYKFSWVDGYKARAAPTTWILAGSSDGGVTWSTLDTRVRVANGLASNTYTITSPASVNSVRCIVQEIYNSIAPVTWCTLSEFDVFYSTTDVISNSVTMGADFTLQSRTTAQRDAMTPKPGAIIFNSTTLTVNFYNGTSWQPV